MRLLSGMGIFKEVEQDTFTPTALAGIYVSGSPLTEAVVHMYVPLIVAVLIVWLSLNFQNLTHECAIQAPRLLGPHRLSEPQ